MDDTDEEPALEEVTDGVVAFRLEIDPEIDPVLVAVFDTEDPDVVVSDDGLRLELPVEVDPGGVAVCEFVTTEDLDFVVRDDGLRLELPVEVDLGGVAVCEFVVTEVLRVELAVEVDFLSVGVFELVVTEGLRVVVTNVVCDVFSGFFVVALVVVFLFGLVARRSKSSSISGFARSSEARATLKDC